jgi:hypothetical protein
MTASQSAGMPRKNPGPGPVCSKGCSRREDLAPEAKEVLANRVHLVWSLCARSELASLRFAPEADVFNASTDVRQVPTTSLRVTLTTLVSATSHFEFIDHPVGATQTTT